MQQLRFHIFQQRVSGLPMYQGLAANLQHDG